jgi:hypothetical protein|tara:strand:- start:4752 stop:5003 length:252 start_codon:yes stop_codon:yes gene_type:complete
MFWSNNSKRLKSLEDKVDQLEKQNAIFVLSMQNIQAALLSASNLQQGVAGDVREIQDLINSILQQAEQASTLHGFDPGDGYEH